MKVGDRVQVIEDEEYNGAIGTLADFTLDGNLIVRLENGWEVHLDPHAVELVEEIGK